MITSTTPYKLVEIIHDTWPNLYRPMKREYNNQKTSKNEKYNSEDYYSVINKNTGVKIADCAQRRRCSY
jgi:hypothetical protein